LKAKMMNDEVLITVEDTGRGIASPNGGTGDARVGVGLANVKRRLRLCYGPETDLLVESSSAGTKVEFAIPLLAETWLRLGR
jgi:LytS/YehU family sensor histidine kinase